MFAEIANFLGVHLPLNEQFYIASQLISENSMTILIYLKLTCHT